MARMTTQTALCIIPPENIWAQIQAIRTIHDRAYPRWMPHINLIYPFVPESQFANIKAQLELVVQRKKPFQIIFDVSSLHYFQQRGEDCTYHIRPTISTDVIELQKSIQRQLSHSNRRAFEAHLTLGQTTKSKINKVLTDIKSTWTTIEFTVDRVYMISRENHPENLFTIKNEILLLNEDETNPLTTSNLVKSSPMNYLCINPSKKFSSHLFHLFEHSSFQPVTPFQFILAEYETGPVNPELRTRIESTSKITLDFGPDSLNFDESTSRLFLKPINLESIVRLNILDGIKYDGTLTLGELHKNDWAKIHDRFTQNWTAGETELVIDRMHLVDVNGRCNFIFRLRN